MSITLILAIVGGAVLWVLFETLGKRTEPANADEAAARRGSAPTPTAQILLFPGMRVIDLRGFPREDLRVGNIDVAREQVSLDAVMQVQVWVVDAETAAGWLELDGVLFLVVSRLCDRRHPAGRNFLHVVGERLDTAACDRFAAAGIEVAQTITNLGDPPSEIADQLECPTRWAPSPDDRPISPSIVLSEDPFDGELIHVVGDFAFVDLRRAAPEALGNGSALERLERVFAILRKRPVPQLVVWVFAPWTLETLPADVAPRLRAMMVAVTPAIGHRLAVVAPAGMAVKNHPVTTALLEAGAEPLQEEYYLRTKDRGAFRVPPITALQDTYYFQAWKHPRL